MESNIFIFFPSNDGNMINIYKKKNKIHVIKSANDLIIFIIVNQFSKYFMILNDK